MNNYSWLQQRLHQLVLSSQFLREVTFDFESSFLSSVSESDNHVFIAGLARSGTTILLNAIYESDEFASLTYADMPFILAPNLWSKISFATKDKILVERAHEDGIKVSTESPEAFEEVFWMTFNDKEDESAEKFKTFVKHINYKYQKKRYLSKNNQNIRRLELFSQIYPNSIMLIPFRDPVQHAYSILTQHKKFIEDSKKDRFISDYMKWIGHTEFGPNYLPVVNENLTYRNDLDINHWIEQWYQVYKRCLAISKNNSNVVFVCYEKLCLQKEYWLEMLKIIDINKKYSFDFRQSKKEISMNIDHNLIKKTSSIYSQLSNFTLK
tara:strand:- start:58 stop:1029 length:972 start_codon:yes stop_codon:yes gene_type:complete